MSSDGIPSDFNKVPRKINRNSRARRKFRQRQYSQNLETLNDQSLLDFACLATITETELCPTLPDRETLLSTPDLAAVPQTYFETIDLRWPQSDSESADVNKLLEQILPTCSFPRAIDIEDLLNGKDISLQSLCISNPVDTVTVDHKVPTDLTTQALPYSETEASSDCATANFYTLEQLKTAALTVPGLRKISGESLVFPVTQEIATVYFQLVARLTDRVVCVKGYANNLLVAEKRSLAKFCQLFEVPIAGLITKDRHERQSVTTDSVETKTATRPDSVDRRRISQTANACSLEPSSRCKQLPYARTNNTNKLSRYVNIQPKYDQQSEFIVPNYPYSAVFFPTCPSADGGQ